MFVKQVHTGNAISNLLNADFHFIYIVFTVPNCYRSCISCGAVITDQVVTKMNIYFSHQCYQGNSVNPPQPPWYLSNGAMNKSA